MSSVAPQGAEITYVNGAGSFRPRLAERIARSRAITIDALDEQPVQDSTPVPIAPPKTPTLVAVAGSVIETDSSEPADPASTAKPSLPAANDTEVPAVACAGLADIAREPSRAATSDEEQTTDPAPDVTSEEAFQKTTGDNGDLLDASTADPEAATASDAPDRPAGIRDDLIPAETDLPALTDARAIEAASQLVSLIAEQRTLLDAIQRAAATATAHQLDPAEDAPATSADALEPDNHPDSVSAAPVALLPHMTTPAADTIGEPERPPMIIERAQADHRAGIAWPAADQAEPPRRMAAFAAGFGLAMVIGAMYWGLRSIV